MVANNINVTYTLTGEKLHEIIVDFNDVTDTHVLSVLEQVICIAAAKQYMMYPLYAGQTFLISGGIDVCCQE